MAWIPGVRPLAEKDIPDRAGFWVGLQGVAMGAWSNHATVGTAPKTNEKTSKLICLLTEIG